MFELDAGSKKSSVSKNMIISSRYFAARKGVDDQENSSTWISDLLGQAWVVSNRIVLIDNEVIFQNFLSQPSFFKDGPFLASFSLFSSFLFNYNW